MRVWLGLACALLATVWLSGAGQAAPELSLIHISEPPRPY